MLHSVRGTAGLAVVFLGWALATPIQFANAQPVNNPVGTVVGGLNIQGFSLDPIALAALQGGANANCLDPDVQEGLIAGGEQLLAQIAPRVGDYMDSRAAGQARYLQATIRSLISIVKRKPPCVENAAYLGMSFSKSWLGLKSRETFAATGQVTNEFSDNKDPAGVGVIGGYKFRPWGNNWVVSPFVSADYLNMSVNHTFINGSFLGTTSNFAATAGVKVGPTFNGFWLYGLAGASLLNETLRVNFVPIASSQTTTVAGATVGFGGAVQPRFLQGFGLPVSLFAEYQHTWWQDAQFNTPAASPFFNYNFRREDDTIKFGFLVSLGAPPPAPAPTYPVKAPRLK